jgi:uncharacterized membrane protein
MAEREAGFISKARLETLADGVFAIVLTLLVLALLDPALARMNTPAELDRALVALWPKVVSYVISFVVVGIFWVAHHTQFHFIRHTNRRHIWINILFLLCVSFLPFSAALLGEYPRYRTPVVLYGANMLAAGASLTLNWWYASHRRRLVEPGLDHRVVERIYHRLSFGPAAYSTALALAFVRPMLSFCLYVATAAAYVGIQLTSSGLETPRADRTPAR